jgi:hypothetical protein
MKGSDMEQIIASVFILLTAAGIFVTITMLYLAWRDYNGGN